MEKTGKGKKQTKLSNRWQGILPTKKKSAKGREQKFLATDIYRLFST